MKILDRYLFSIFGTAFALVTITFVALFTAMDLSSRIARILSLKNINTLSFLVQYYLVRLPMFLHLVLPAVTLFASMFTVIQLQKTNELLPMITSGVSLRRLSFIFVAGALVCAALMGILDEFVLPALMDPIGETDDILISDKPLKGLLIIASDLVFNVDEYDRVNRRMKGLLLTRYRENGKRREVIRAETATWEHATKTWILRNGEKQPFEEDGSPKLVHTPGQSPRIFVEPLKPEGERISEPDPKEFQRRYSLSGRNYRYGELMELINKNPRIPTYWMHVHLKFASPLGPLVLLFLGLPFVAGTQHRSFYRGVGLCLLLTIAYYAATFVCFELGIRGGSLSPAVAVWGPIAVFGLAGLVSFLRMRS